MLELECSEGIGDTKWVRSRDEATYWIRFNKSMARMKFVVIRTNAGSFECIELSFSPDWPCFVTSRGGVMEYSIACWSTVTGGNTRACIHVGRSSITMSSAARADPYDTCDPKFVVMTPTPVLFMETPPVHLYRSHHAIRYLDE